MREIVFIKENETKWKEFEAALAAGNRNLFTGNDQPRRKRITPDELAEMFIELTDDLSYARTFYPESEVVRYLNQLTSKFHAAIYVNKKEKTNRFKNFWLYEVPHAVRRNHKNILASLVIVLIFAGIGALSAYNDPTFVNVVMGDGYVNMSKENIKEGKPMSVYASSGEVDMFFFITINNIGVSLRAFVYGIALSAGTVYFLFVNGFMLGAFHMLFFNEGVVAEFLLAVYVHGTLEISALIIAGGAGLTMGNSILFPGTYSRMESFKRGAKDGLKIVIGLVPIFIMAGFLESFVTRHTDMPLVLNLLIIIVSLSFIIYYFILYPYRIRHLDHEPVSENRLL